MAIAQISNAAALFCYATAYACYNFVFAYFVFCNVWNIKIFGITQVPYFIFFAFFEKVFINLAFKGKFARL